MGVAAGAGSRPAWSAPAGGSTVTGSGLSENTASALCYVLGFITGVIFLLVAPYNTNRTVRFHAWQSIFLSIAAVVINWALRLIFFHVLHFWILGATIMSLVDLFWVVVWIYMIFTTYNGRMVKLPFIGDYAQNQAGTVRS
jgi:uncharacterized membrane protein